MDKAEGPLVNALRLIQRDVAEKKTTENEKMLDSVSSMYVYVYVHTYLAFAWTVYLPASYPTAVTRVRFVTRAFLPTRPRRRTSTKLSVERHRVFIYPTSGEPSKALETVLSRFYARGNVLAGFLGTAEIPRKWPKGWPVTICKQTGSR